MLDKKRWNIGDIFKVFLFYFFMMLVGIPVFLRVSKQIFRFDYHFTGIAEESI